MVNIQLNCTPSKGKFKTVSQSFAVNVFCTLIIFDYLGFQLFGGPWEQPEGVQESAISSVGSCSIQSHQL
jgi:hypothetical protein